MKDYIAISREIKRRGEAKRNARKRHIHHALAACLLLCICLPLGFGVWQLASPAESPSLPPSSEIAGDEESLQGDSKPPVSLPGGQPEQEESDYSEEPVYSEEPDYSEEPVYSEEPDYSEEWERPETDESGEEPDPPCAAPAPYVPAEKVVLNPENQNAKVFEKGEPPADVTVLTSLQAKKSYFAKYAQSPHYDQNGNPRPLEIEERYDKAFFEKNSLLAVFREENSGSNSLKLKEVVIHTDGTVEVILDRRVPGPGEEGTCDIRQWMFFIEIPVEHPITSENPVKLTVEEAE